MSNNFKFSKQKAHLVETVRITGVTSSAPVRVHQVPAGAAIKAYPTAAGTATVYSTTATRELSDLDDTAVKIAASTNAAWDAWGAGAITATNTQKANVPLQTVALTVASGNWVFEVTA
jgi:hypothetical protein